MTERVEEEEGVHGLKIDFFIAGFPKSGTTSVAQWLASHQDIAFSDPKEPGFFCDDFPGKRKVTDPNDYLNCWSGRNNEKVCGEGTVVYIYSRQAIEKILLSYPDAKFLVLIRRPADLVRSLHSNNFRSFQEDISSLEDAWKMQGERQTGGSIPPTCNEPFFLQYREVARQGKYLKQLIDLCGQSKVHTIVLDNLAKNNKKEYRDIVHFLGLDIGEYPDFSLANEQRSFKSGLWSKIGRRILGFARQPGLKKLRTYIPVSSLGVDQYIYKLTTEKDVNTSIPAQLEKIITSELESDVQLLRELTGEPLSDW